MALNIRCSMHQLTTWDIIKFGLIVEGNISLINYAFGYGARVVLNCNDESQEHALISPGFPVEAM